MFLALGEGGLVLMGLFAAWLARVSVPFRVNLEALGVSLVAAVGFAALNLTLYRLGRRLGRPAGVFTFLEGEVFPLFRALSGREVVVLVCLAGLGEELFFRGVLQPVLGLGVASLIFGLFHGPTRELWPLALWATVMGALLGWLYRVSDNLFVPVVAHALYDGVALAYVRSLPPVRTP